MPFDTSSGVEGQALYPGVSDYDHPAPDFLETVEAAFRQENLIVAPLVAKANKFNRDFYRIDSGYDVYEDIKGYEAFAPRFEQVYNREARNAVVSDIEREKKDRKTLAASGWTGTGLSVAAGVTDPTIFIPAGTFIKAGRVGYSTARTMTSVGVGAGVGAGVQEAGLQAFQQTRTASESLTNVGGTVLLGGLIGAAGARFFSAREWKQFGTRLEEELAEDAANPADVAEIIVDRMKASGGAAAVDDIKLDDLGVGGPRVARAIANATEFIRINPGVQTLMSPSAKAREAYVKLVDNPIYTRMNMEGRSTGPAVENLVKQYQRGALSQWLRSSKEQWKRSRQEARAAGEKPLTRLEFNIRVAKAGRRGDVDPDGNRYITQAAQDARSQVFDPLLKRAIDAGLLPDDVKVTTSASYVTRLWNRQRLIAEEERFREIAREYFRKAISQIPTADRPDFVTKADLDDYIEEVVSSVFDNLTGKGEGDIPEWVVPVTRGPLKERTFRIPDEDVEDFLESDMEAVLRRYTRTMGAEVELADKFGRADMRDQIADIAREYRDLRKKAKTSKERMKLQQAEQRDQTNLTAFRDMVRGTYRAAEEGSEWSRITRAALAWNYMRLLGGVLLTSLTDSMRLLGVHGVRATMREALPALVSNMQAIRISRADARDLGAVTEAVLQTRIAQMAELNDPYRYGSTFDRYLSNSVAVFSKATGLAYWNDTVKMISAVMTQNRMARNAIGWSKAGQRERAYMAKLGIDEDMAGRIAGQLQKYGLQDKNIWGANVGRWDDEYAARVWRAAVNADVDRTIVTKGVADQPLWTRTNWGRLLMQFKSFGMASHQRVLLSGLQEYPHRFAEQMVFGTALGMLIAYAKFIERGDTDRAQNLFENPGLWIADGLDRTGILFLPFEVSNTMDKLSANYGGPNVGITAGISALAGDEDSSGGVSRYASRNAAGTLGGPTLGVVEDLVNIAAGLSDAKEGMTRGQSNALLRQIPGGTLPGFRSAIHIGLKPALQE